MPIHEYYTLGSYQCSVLRPDPRPPTRTYPPDAAERETPNGPLHPVPVTCRLACTRPCFSRLPALLPQTTLRSTHPRAEDSEMWLALRCCCPPVFHSEWVPPARLEGATLQGGDRPTPCPKGDVTCSIQPGLGMQVSQRAANGACAVAKGAESTNWHVEIDDGLTRPPAFVYHRRDDRTRTDSSDLAAQPTPTRHRSRGGQGVMGVTIVTGGGRHHRIREDGRPTVKRPDCIPPSRCRYMAASSTLSATTEPTNNPTHPAPTAEPHDTSTRSRLRGNLQRQDHPCAYPSLAYTPVHAPIHPPSPVLTHYRPYHPSTHPQEDGKTIPPNDRTPCPVPQPTSHPIQPPTKNKKPSATSNKQ